MRISVDTLISSNIQSISKSMTKAQMDVLDERGQSLMVEKSPFYFKANAD